MKFRDFNVKKTTEKRLLCNLEQPGHHCLHLLKNNTSCTKNLFPWLGELRDENKALLFFTGWEAQFKILAIPYNPLDHCLRKDFLTHSQRFDLQCLKILYFHTWVDPSKLSIKLNLNGLVTDFQSWWIVALGILPSPRIFRFYSPRVQEY